FLSSGVRHAARGLDRARREDAQHLAADGFVDPQAAERDAAVGAMIERGALAAVAWDIAPRARVADVEPTPAVTTSQHAGQQARPPTNGPSHHQPLHLRVVSDELLSAFVDVPRNIGLVVVAQQRDPLVAGLPMAPRLMGTAIDH